MLDLRQYFDMAIVVCLDKRKDEWHLLDEQFEQFKLPIRKFIVGAGTILPTDTYDYIDNPNPPCGRKRIIHGIEKPIKPQNYNYVCSIHGCIQLAKDAGVNTLLYLEDDAMPYSHFTKYFMRAQEQINKRGVQWDLLYLAGAHGSATTYEIAPNLIKIMRTLSFHAVGIHQKVFDGLLKTPKCIGWDAYMAAFFQRKCNVYAIWPSLVGQRPGYSYNTFRYEDRNPSFWSKGRVEWSDEEIWEDNDYDY